MDYLTILGATGSIGDSALDVVRHHPESFKIWGLSANSNTNKLAKITHESEPHVVAVGENYGADIRAKLQNKKVDIFEGRTGLNSLARMPEAAIVVVGIVGGAGLEPTLQAVRAGKRVLIANKEPLVMMGSEIMREAALSQATILPLDSEHNAIFQCLPSILQKKLFSPVEYGKRVTATDYGVTKVVLTASGGPFLNFSSEELKNVTLEKAVAHPKWKMGRKISVDSATMMNKGLELIEACVLLNIEPNLVEVVVHPQSIVHSLVEYKDGSFLAQIANPDMRIPIANALGYPNRIASGAPNINIQDLGGLDFLSPDESRFPCLKLARQAAELGGSAPVILNAANEIAVEAFCNRIIGFTHIWMVIEKVLSHLTIDFESGLESVLHTDKQARLAATECIKELTKYS